MGLVFGESLFLIARHSNANMNRIPAMYSLVHNKMLSKVSIDVDLCCCVCVEGFNSIHKFFAEAHFGKCIEGKTPVEPIKCFLTIQGSCVVAWVLHGDSKGE